MQGRPRDHATTLAAFRAILLVIALAGAAMVAIASDTQGQSTARRSSAVASPAPTASHALPSTTGTPDELPPWSPVEPTSIPIAYVCADGRRFTAADLASGPVASTAIKRLIGYGTWRILHDDGERVLLGKVIDPPLQGTFMEDTLFERTLDGWRWVGGGDCLPWARFDELRAVGGYWRLDPTKPAPRPGSRRIHAKVWYTGWCRAAVTMRGRPVVHLTAEAVLIAMPVTTSRGDHCEPGRATRVVVELPERLGHRAIYDAAFLPIRQVWETSTTDAAAA